VAAREQFLKALALNPALADAYLGPGLYNYYVDTLSAAARILRFFMGIPGGSKKEGVRQLKIAIAEGVLTPPVARFYLAINLHSFDQQYEHALEVLTPLVEKYPSNALFQLAQGDLYAKLGRENQALASYEAAEAAHTSDPACNAHVKDLVRVSRAAVEARTESKPR
jgi:tetratricopeptide (TPR) repeat protein